MYEVDAKHFTRFRDIVFYENKFHTFDEVTNSTFFYKDNVDDETQPDGDARDELEIPTIPITTTESPENLPSVGATYEDTYATSEKPWSNQTEKSTRKISFRRIVNC